MEKFDKAVGLCDDGEDHVPRCNLVAMETAEIYLLLRSLRRRISLRCFVFD